MFVGLEFLLELVHACISMLFYTDDSILVFCTLRSTKYLRSHFTLLYYSEHLMTAFQGLFSSPFLKYLCFHLLVCVPPQNFWETFCGLAKANQYFPVSNLTWAGTVQVNSGLLRGALGRSILSPRIIAEESPRTRRGPGWEVGMKLLSLTAGRKRRRQRVLEDFPFKWLDTSPLLFKSVCSGFYLQPISS